VSHPWLETVSETVNPGSLKLPGPLAVLGLLANGQEPAVELVEARRTKNEQYEILVIKVRVDRPQDCAADIRRHEPVALIFGLKDIGPSTMALREDFPDTPHQHGVPKGWPASMCVDDRPWQEAKLTWSATDQIYRTRTWLERAARGELIDEAQPVEPLFMRSRYALVVPPDCFSKSEQPIELSAHAYETGGGEPYVVVAVPGAEAPNSPAKLVVLALQGRARQTGRLRYLPQNLAELSEELGNMGIDLMPMLKSWFTKWAGSNAQARKRLGSHLAIAVAFDIVRPDTEEIVGVDRRAFFIEPAIGNAGSALGWLGAQPDQSGGFMPLLGAPVCSPGLGKDVAVQPLDLYIGFHRQFAAEISGRTSLDDRRIAMVGAGSLGSHLATTLVREGAFKWTILDHDHLLPHNLARHALPAAAVGQLKAPALAHHLQMIVHDATVAEGLPVNMLSDEATSDAVTSKMVAADLILDASASVAVSRHLSDLEVIKSRRFSVFFNPAGTALVMLAEDSDRTVTLRDLEAQYYRLILNKPELAGHLEAPEGVRYSGSCRSLTNRIPQHRASMLSAIAAGAVADSLDDPQAQIAIWTLGSGGNVNRITENGEKPTHRMAIDDWMVTIDEGMLRMIRALRVSELPNETGGLLAGVVDRVSKSIHLVAALPAPADSKGDPSGFERGVQGTSAAIEDIYAKTMGQVRYVGEWHSHPEGSSAAPSRTDIGQMYWLSTELMLEAHPAVVLIVGEKGETVNLAMALETAE
jgi:proteasome lid subunit RPN8/RPN11